MKVGGVELREVAEWQKLEALLDLRWWCDEISGGGQGVTLQPAAAGADKREWKRGELWWR
jgi:hypothetical protein